MISANGSGMFSFSHTGPADLAGSSWDATAVEGSQNFPDYSDHGDAHQELEEYKYFPGHITPRKDQAESMELPNKWEVSAPSSAEPMRQTSSRSSTGSHKSRNARTRASSIKRRAKIMSAMSQETSAMSNYDMSSGNNTLAYQDGSMTHGRIMDVNPYMMQAGDAMPVASHFTGLPLSILTTDAMTYHSDLTAPMTLDPTCTQMHMDFEPSLGGNSPGESWDSFSSGRSGMSSPGATDDDAWSLALVASPTDTHASTSPHFKGESPSRSNSNYASHMVTEDLNGSGMTAIADDFALPPAFPSRRASSEGESARDHPLYKQVAPAEDGLFHCPWEGQTSCNHRPEKLKCNYDKFVDSHLKPYRCKHEHCENARFSSTACLLRHEREAHAMHGHGDKPYLCTYEACERALPGNGFPRQWNLRDHMRRVHHDNGQSLQTSVAASPPPTGSSQNQAKGRKRKKESENSNTRKASSKEKSSCASKAVETTVCYSEWERRHADLTTLVRSLPRPDDPAALRYIQEAEEHLTAIRKISTTLVSGNKTSVVQGAYCRDSQSG